jgi:recA bacterial DNA recombination protein
MFKQGDYFDINGKKLPKSCENPAGNLVQVSLLKSKVCRGDRKLDYYTLNYITGIDYINDVIDVLIKENVIIQKASYYDIVDKETGEIIKKFQGRQALYQEIKTNIELYDKLVGGINYN